MEEYIVELQTYLPLNYLKSENNEYIKYLTDACEETSALNKDQFSLIAFHMLYMSYVFKVVWQSNQVNHNNIQNLLQNYNSKLGNYDNPFDLSIVSEKESIKFLKCFDFHINKISQFSSPIDNRDHCAHASGFVQYKKPEVERIVNDEVNHIKIIHEKTKGLIDKLFRNFFTSSYKPDDAGSYFPSGLESVDKFISINLLSLKDLEMVKTIDFDFLQQESSNRDVIFQKVFYLLTLAKYDDYFGGEFTSFVEKFPLLLNGMAKQNEIKIDDLIENELSTVWQSLSVNQRNILLSEITG